ncbi:MAG: NADH-quinone oxidoreductase subunit NuoG [Alphaproteobacteria bacterium]|nr:NADH-quinone oxidoreductase subunit NuoG [Alphaproteobacteria bacterium]
MPKLTINGQEIEVDAGLTVLQACEQAGVEIPRFCYHERLSIAGNCRMCLVEVKPGPPKPAASCALPVGDGMEVFTDTPMVKKARNGVMEFLLINHPLDCPICDQGGECDLQDQAMAYGYDGSRYDENKRAVKEKYMGPLVKTIMTRCIHCTRCIRFCAEVGGVEDIGMINRGENAEITTLEKAIQSEMSGNVIDLCPVGALTSKPYAFTARSWELTKTESIDVMDAVGSNIRVDARGNEVMRILPRLNEDVNEEWISDKTRFACDGLKRQRLDRPYLRKDGKLSPVGWPEAFAGIADKVKSVGAGKVAAVAGDLCDVESLFALKELMAKIGSPHLDCRQDGAALDASVRGSYLFNTTIAGIEDADACLIIGSNPRKEAPIINSRLRKRWLMRGFEIGVVGPRHDLGFDTAYLGAGPETLDAIAKGDTPFADVLKKAERPMLILGMGALARADGAAVLEATRAIAEDCGMVAEGWNGFNVLHTAAARVGGLDLGFVPGKDGRNTQEILDGAASGDIGLVYLLGADEIDTAKLEKTFVVYQGHHGDAGAHAADVILPGAAYTEKNAIYVNTEGRVQLAQRAVFPPGDAREDWAILRALSEHLGEPLGFDTQDALRENLRAAHPGFLAIDTAESGDWQAFGKKGKMTGEPFVSPIANFYMSDPISRNSETMARCVEELTDASTEATGTDG